MTKIAISPPAVGTAFRLVFANEKGRWMKSPFLAPAILNVVELTVLLPAAHTCAVTLAVAVGDVVLSSTNPAGITPVGKDTELLAAMSVDATSP